MISRINYKRTFIRQLAIFFSYLFFCSLVLFNHTGGADIIFMALITISFIIHFIIVITKWIKDKKSDRVNRWTYLDLLILIAIIIVSIVLANKYGEFMWWLTNAI